jgi:rod shape-determining protein MreD
MKALILFVVMAVSVSLQSTVIPVLSIGGVRPDLVLVVVVSVALSVGKEMGVLCGVFGGLLQDLLSVGPFGYNTLTKMLLGLLVGLYERKVNKGTLLLPLLAVAVSTLGVAVVAAIFLLAYGQERQIAVLLLQLIPATAYHILLVVPVHYLVTWLMRDQSNK